MLLVGLRWLLDTEQPAEAIVSHHGQRLASADNRVLRFVPHGPGERAFIAIEVHRIDWVSWGCPRNPLAPSELSDIAALLGDVGQRVVETRDGHPGITGSLALSTSSHPSLLAAVRRYSAGCPRHGGRVLCRWGWYRAGAHQAIDVHDLNRQMSEHDQSKPGHPTAADP